MATTDPDVRIRAAVDELAAALLAAVGAPGREQPDRLLSVEAAAEVLNLGRSKVYLEVAEGRLRSIKVGRRRLVPQTALQEFIDQADSSR